MCTAVMGTGQNKEQKGRLFPVLRATANKGDY